MKRLDNPRPPCANQAMQDTLSNAYALDGPEACKDLYRGWASTYDLDFAQARDYRLPLAVAQAAVAARPAPRRVLDVGAGTGLVAQALRAQGMDAPIDGIDLSPDMLAIAKQKRVYDRLIEADVTLPLTHGARYDLLVSAGTFTHGHVGADALALLAQTCDPGAEMVISINEKVFEEKGFKTLLDVDPRFRNHIVTRAAIYGDAARTADPSHAQDTALIVRITLP